MLRCKCGFRSHDAHDHLEPSHSGGLGVTCCLDRIIHMELSHSRGVVVVGLSDPIYSLGVSLVKRVQHHTSAKLCCIAMLDLDRMMHMTTWSRLILGGGGLGLLLVWV